MPKWKDNQLDAMKERAGGVRFRAWSLSLIIVVALIFYLLVNVVFNQTINIVDIVIITLLQFAAMTIWFPEGVRWGERNKIFQANRKAYNRRATIVALHQKTSKLREFCVIDFEERKQKFIEKTLGRIGIDVAEFELLRRMEKHHFEIKRRTLWQVLKGIPKPKAEAVEIAKGQTILLNDVQKAVLYRLIFKEIKIEKNNPDTIMSGLEIDEAHAIKNAEATYKRKVFVLRIIQSFVIGIVLAYIGYTLRDGIGLVEIVRIISYVLALLFAIVLAFTQGEESIKTHKNSFMLQLVNFLDRFFEYAELAAVNDAPPVEKKITVNNEDTEKQGDE